MRGGATRNGPVDDPARRRARGPRLLAIPLFVVVVGVVAILVTGQGGHRRSSARREPTGGQRSSHRHPNTATQPLAVGLRMLTLVDRSRTVLLPTGSDEPRTLVTFVRYPAFRGHGTGDQPGAPPARSRGPFPLIVFGHGFGVTPSLYSPILRAWTRAGFVVAAPVFPLENADAPGGPYESDLVNQPTDMRYVISRLLSASAARSGPLAGLIDPSRVVVAGQSDGGDTALAVAYDRSFRDARVRAAIILSGGEIPGTNGFAFPAGGPPLLATQGTADTINPPSATNEFFTSATRPKYLLELLGAEHLPPYSSEQPQLGIVEHVSAAFLDAYVNHDSGALKLMSAAGNVTGVAKLIEAP